MPLVIAPAPARSSSAQSPIIIEIGPGRGDFLFHLARTDPAAIICGIEIKWRRFEKLRERRERDRLANVALIYGDARVAVPQLACLVDKVYVQFPDPWPKRRHAWHRILDAEFLGSCARRLKTGGEIWFITDDKLYAESTAALFIADPGWQTYFAQPIVTNCPDAFPTHFAQKWRAEGRTIYYQRYKRS
ncbi:MAG: hypothetical protein HYV03_07490 [Deltaproteobacteria bacterium]|nr:hypothetical protein [Deltaproteobacteria bacterium]